MYKNINSANTAYCILYATFVLFKKGALFSANVYICVDFFLGKQIIYTIYQKSADIPIPIPNS